jgi:hypothetical protein
MLTLLCGEVWEQVYNFTGTCYFGVTPVISPDYSHFAEATALVNGRMRFHFDKIGRHL